MAKIFRKQSSSSKGACSRVALIKGFIWFYGVQIPTKQIAPLLGIFEKKLSYEMHPRTFLHHQTSKMDGVPIWQRWSTDRARRPVIGQESCEANYSVYHSVGVELISQPRTQNVSLSPSFQEKAPKVLIIGSTIQTENGRSIRSRLRKMANGPVIDDEFGDVNQFCRGE